MFSVLRRPAVYQVSPLKTCLSLTSIRSFSSRFSSSSARTLTAGLNMHSTPTPKSKVLVLGAGNFGSCLADHLGDCDHEVYIWSREASFVNHFNTHHRNPNYLKDHVFSSNIHAVGPEIPDRGQIQQMDVVLFAIPTQGVRYGLLLSFGAFHCNMICPQGNLGQTPRQFSWRKAAFIDLREQGN